MSDENVRLSLLATEAFNERDVEAVVRLFSSDCLWIPAMEADAEGDRTYHGHAGLRQYYRDLAEFSERSRVEWDQVRDLGDQVLALGQFEMRFTSGVELDWEAACLFTWRDQKCLEARTWRSRAEGIAAAGLLE
jgi:ketosteroid isomerase-like protein